MVDLVEQARAVHRGKYYVVMARGNLDLQCRKVVLHYIDGVVDTLAFYDVCTADHFDRRDASSTFTRMTLDEALRLGAHLLDYTPRHSYSQLCLVVHLCVRGGESAVAPESDFEQKYPDTRFVLRVRVSWAHFSGQPTSETVVETMEDDEDVADAEYVVKTKWLSPDEFDAVLGRTARTLQLAARCYER